MAAASGAAGSLPKTFRAGTKKVFLPWHHVALLAPRPSQPPTFATFEVPLTFNKFDLRDYLFHVYNTPVLAVRSQIRQPREIERDNSGRLRRRQPIKTMTVQLTQPFVWPSMPTDDSPWMKPHEVKIKKAEETRDKTQKQAGKTGRLPLRDELKEPESRRNLRNEAERLLKEGGWTNKRELDPRFPGKGEARKS